MPPTEATTNRLLIAGCGYVGTRAAAALAEAGHRVWGLARHPQDLPTGVQPLAADVTRPATLAALPAGLDGVAYLVAASGGGDDAYREAYVDGPRHLLDALRARGSEPRFVHVSSTGVYGHDDGAEVDERTPPEPRASSSRLLLEGERIVAAAPFRSVVLRLGGIYGPSRTHFVDAVRDGSLAIDPSRDDWTNRIHADDAAAAVVHLLLHRDPEPLYLGVDHEPARRRDVAAWLAQRLGVPLPGTRPSATPRRGDKRCRNDLLLASGFRFRYPTYREGYAQLLASQA